MDIIVTYFISECSPLFLSVPSGMVWPQVITWPFCVFHWQLLLKFKCLKLSSRTCRQSFATGMIGWVGFFITVAWSILAVDLCCFNLLHAWKHGRACTLLDTLWWRHLLLFLFLFQKSILLTKRPRRNHLKLCCIVFDKVLITLVII